MIDGKERCPPPETGARERLLKAALELFATKGYAATTVREIVASAGVTKPVLYYYFKNKEGIYLELVQSAYDSLELLMAEALHPSGTATERIVHFLEKIFGLFMEKIDTVRVIYSIFYGPPQGAPFFDYMVYQVKLRQSILQLVEEGIAAGEFRQENSDDMVGALMGAIQVAMDSQLCGDQQRIDRDGLVRIINVIFRGMAIDKENFRGIR